MTADLVFFFSESDSIALKKFSYQAAATLIYVIQHREELRINFLQKMFRASLKRLVYTFGVAIFFLMNP